MSKLSNIQKITIVIKDFFHKHNINIKNNLIEEVIIPGNKIYELYIYCVSVKKGDIINNNIDKQIINDIVYFLTNIGLNDLKINGNSDTKFKVELGIIDNIYKEISENNFSDINVIQLIISIDADIIIREKGMEYYLKNKNNNTPTKLLEIIKEFEDIDKNLPIEENKEKDILDNIIKILSVLIVSAFIIVIIFIIYT